MNTLLIGDCATRLREIESGSIQCCITSPPYFGLRDYGHEAQIGRESSVAEYVEALVGVFREVRRVLRDDGTLWLNLGDSYASPRGGGMQGKHGQRADRRFTPDHMQPKGMTDGLKPKDLIGIPWRVAFALQADGWWLRQDIVWAKPNPMPESVTDRCTKAHEYLFLLAKSESYYFDHEAIKEPANPANHRTARRSLRESPGQHVHAGMNGDRRNYETRNRRSVWTVSTRPYRGSHFATFPEDLVEPCILAGSRPGDIVLDPFAGSGTTLAVASRHGRTGLGCELNEEYARLAIERLGVFGLSLRRAA